MKTRLRKEFIEKAKEVPRKLKKILSKCRSEISLKEEFILEYIQLIAEFRLNFFEEKNKKTSSFGCFSDAINKKKGLGRNLGFLEQDLYPLNIFISEQPENSLRRLIDLIASKLKGPNELRKEGY